METELGLAKLQGWTFQKLPGKLVPLHYCPSWCLSFSYIKSELGELMFQLMPLVSHPIMHLCMDLAHREAALRSPWSFVFPNLNKPSTLSFSSQKICPVPPKHPHDLLNSLQFVNAFLVLKDPKLDAVFQMWSDKCWIPQVQNLGVTIPNFF